MYRRFTTELAAMPEHCNSEEDKERMPPHTPLINHTSSLFPAPRLGGAAQHSGILPDDHHETHTDPVNELQIQAAAEAFGSSAHTRRFGHRFAGAVEDAFQVCQTEARAKSLVPWLVMMVSLLVQPVAITPLYRHLDYLVTFECVVLSITVVAWYRFNGSIPVLKKANLMQWMVAAFVTVFYIWVSSLVYISLHLESPDDAAWIGMSMWLTMPPLAIQISLQPRAWLNSIGATCTAAIFFSSSALPDRGLGAIIYLPLLVWLLFHQEECARANFLTTLRNIQLSNEVSGKCVEQMRASSATECCFSYGAAFLNIVLVIRLPQSTSVNLGIATWRLVPSIMQSNAQ